ncbi:hypothetical protein LR48_Vigan05g032900 [Vigna angularis]|uniref:Uncharacterized protein n=1 Tax=Phaseolus angularis TaxID=3914 RepID=A0A0L9UIK0_PHAAN|nr:hypothetical protein LR48_Vigan05g032900 [Vigna angularis]
MPNQKTIHSAAAFLATRHRRLRPSSHPHSHPTHVLIRNRKPLKLKRKQRKKEEKETCAVNQNDQRPRRVVAIEEVGVGTFAEALPLSDATSPRLSTSSLATHRKEEDLGLLLTAYTVSVQNITELAPNQCDSMAFMPRF